MRKILNGSFLFSKVKAPNVGCGKVFEYPKLFSHKTIALSTVEIENEMHINYAKIEKKYHTHFPVAENRL